MDGGKTAGFAILLRRALSQAHLIPAKSLLQASMHAPCASLCLSQLGKRDMTADEVADAIGESVLSTRPRLSELRRMGKITDTGLRHKNRSGKNAVVWRLT